MNNILQSPRLKLISNFKTTCGDNYEKMYLSNLSEKLLHLKLKCYVNSLLLQVKISNNFQGNLKSIEHDTGICVLNDNTLLKTYTIDHISKLKNESQLGISLFIDWGYLLSFLDEFKNSEQLTLII
ncbi:hypothetical protein FDB39_17495 [Clostridium botulinum]|nr:hypothetical protein [Clostridium botulinum]